MTSDDVTTLIRILFLLVPTFLWVMQFALRFHSIPAMAGSFLAFVWQFQSSLILNVIAVYMGWWKFDAYGASLYGVPIDFIIFQSVVVGLLVFIQSKPMSIFLAFPILGGAYIWSAALDIIDFTRDLPWGVLLIYGASIIPSLLLGFWTKQNGQLYARAFLQPWAWASLLLWLFPSVLFGYINHDWSALLNRSLWLNALYATPLILPGFLILNSLYVFAVDGKGTGFPYDPPRYLVTSGVYGYISNPMQLGICLMMLWWGVMLESLYVSLTMPIALLLFFVFKNICNGSSQIGQMDPDWKAYQNNVPKWLPRFTRWEKGR